MDAHTAAELDFPMLAVDAFNTRHSLGARMGAAITGLLSLVIGNGNSEEIETKAEVNPTASEHRCYIGPQLRKSAREALARLQEMR